MGESQICDGTEKSVPWTSLMNSLANLGLSQGSILIIGPMLLC